MSDATVVQPQVVQPQVVQPQVVQPQVVQPQVVQPQVVQPQVRPLPSAADLKGALDALIEPKKPGRSLPALPDRRPLPGTRASATSIPPKPTTSGTAGIASPLTEIALNSRSYYEDKSIMSSDGIFVVVLKPVATLQMTDANGLPVVFVFNNPS